MLNENKRFDSNGSIFFFLLRLNQWINPFQWLHRPTKSVCKNFLNHSTQTPCIFGCWKRIRHQFFLWPTILSQNDHNYKFQIMNFLNIFGPNIRFILPSSVQPKKFEFSIPFSWKMTTGKRDGKFKFCWFDWTRQNELDDNNQRYFQFSR